MIEQKSTLTRVTGLWSHSDDLKHVRHFQRHAPTEIARPLCLARPGSPCARVEGLALVLRMREGALRPADREAMR